ncbi:hypothetical protein M758_UG318900 [Ceratodon purpureus]|nr:hypothetical protein M758_UG318900 [Ceratodon purpureus]
MQLRSLQLNCKQKSLLNKWPSEMRNYNPPLKQYPNRTSSWSRNDPIMYSVSRLKIVHCLSNTVLLSNVCRTCHFHELAQKHFHWTNGSVTVWKHTIVQHNIHASDFINEIYQTAINLILQMKVIVCGEKNLDLSTKFVSKKSSDSGLIWCSNIRILLYNNVTSRPI